MDGGSSVEECIRERYPELVRAVAAVTRSVPAAEDAVAEAFARAWERERKGQEFEHLAGWVVTVALNLARSRWRKIGRERPLPDRSGIAAANVESDLTLDVRAAVAELPRHQREAVILHYLMDLDVATTASLLGVSDGTMVSGRRRAPADLAIGQARFPSHDCNRMPRSCVLLSNTHGAPPGAEHEDNTWTPTDSGSMSWASQPCSRSRSRLRGWFS